MAVSNQQKNLHLLWRAGFGPSVDDLASIDKISQDALFKNMLSASAKAPAYIDVTDNYIKQLIMGADDNDGMMQRRQLSDEQKKELRVKSRDGIKNLNLTWLSQMINSQQQLREKMSLFWHGHFATRTINIFYQQKLLDTIRTNALGNFGDLLRSVSKSASMINFLNNNQNRKGHPNENFAREVMELFTLGRGNYTENDIKESARAFTGWGANLNGEFVFRPRLHDDGQKSFLGKSGNFDGDDILKILLEQKQTARFITRKIYRYFVNTDEDNEKIEWLANRFYQHYNIEKLMTDIFTSDWFYSEKNIGARIKSPVELIVGIRRILPMQIENEASQLLLQRLLGQVLFYPPNVAGWPGGKNWIDSSTLMMRLRIPQLIYAGDSFRMRPKDDDDQMMGMKDRDDTDDDSNNKIPAAGKRNNARNGQQIMATINWDGYIKQLEPVTRENLVSNISKNVLQAKTPVNPSALQGHTDASTREAFIKTTTIQLMSTPEYQLC
ncbi:MAG: DUF1800 domain-containing protein [Chitinophagaceae bacterium]